MYDITIVGLGAAGIFTLALLPDKLLPRVLVLEPNAVGGELSTLYGAVIANITKKEIVDAFRAVPRWRDQRMSILERYPDDFCPPLADIMRQMRALIAPELTKVSFKAQRYTHLERTATHWVIHTSTTMFETQKVILCTGAAPRTYDLPLPAIPLHIALTPHALAAYIRPPASVIVFGTSHSGTLVLRNLKDLRIDHVMAYYTGEKPFVYARDGHTEGIKQESAAIADEIQSGAWHELTPLINPFMGFQEIPITDNTYVVYACGFDRPPLKFMTTDCKTVSAKHNGTYFTDSEGSIIKNLYGFGIGYPSFYTAPSGARYPDVGFAGFVGAIQALLAEIYCTLDLSS